MPKEVKRNNSYGGYKLTAPKNKNLKINHFKIIQINHVRGRYTILIL